MRIHIDGEGLRLLAELTLAMVLFTDAANADFSIVKRNLDLPKWLLLIGLPLTIVLGFAVAAVVSPARDFGNGPVGGDVGADRRGAGKPVVTNPAVPPAMREALNLEAVSTTALRADRSLVARTSGRHAIEAGLWRMCSGGRRGIGIGLIVGLALTWLTTLMLRFAESRGWISEHWVEIPIVALAATCFGQPRRRAAAGLSRALSAAFC